MMRLERPNIFLIVFQTEEDAAVRSKTLSDAVTDINIDRGKGTGKVQTFARGRQGGPKAKILIQFILILKRALRENICGNGQACDPTDPSNLRRTRHNVFGGSLKWV
jgi:hypothetical protein